MNKRLIIKWVFPFLVINIFLILFTASAAEKEILIGAPWCVSEPLIRNVSGNIIAAQVAIDEINSSGGVNGMPLKMIYYNSENNPKTVVNVVNKLVKEDNVLAIIGPFGSGECSVAFPMANRLGIAMISQGSARSGLARKHRPFAFRNTVDEVRMAKVACKAFMSRYKVKRFVVVHDIRTHIGISIGSKVLPLVLEMLEAEIVNKGNYITFKQYNSGMTKEVEELKKLDFDAVAFGGVGEDVARLVLEMRAQGLNQPIIGGSALLGPALELIAGKVADGIMAPCTFYTSIAPKDFLDKFSDLSKKNKTHFSTIPTQFDANTYEILYFLKHVMEKTKISNNPENLVEERRLIMKGLSAFRIQGLVGPISFNTDGDAIKPVYVAEIRGGRWTINR